MYLSNCVATNVIENEEKHCTALLPSRQLYYEQVLFLTASVCLFVCLSAQNLENY